MTRLAEGRTTHLSAEEIAVEMLRQYDVGPKEPSTRSLAEALNVTPRAIYHYYATRADVVQAAIRLVWEEATEEVLVRLADPSYPEGDSLEFFVVAALAARHAFDRHHRIATQLSATWLETDSRTAGAVTIMTALLEQAGLDAESAGVAMYTFLTYTVGSVLLDASRRAAAEKLALEGVAPPPVFTSVANRPSDAPAVSEETSAVVDKVMGLSPRARAGDDALFEAGLRLLLAHLAVPTGP